MIAQLQEKLPDHPIRSMDEFISLFAAQTRDMASSFIDAIMGIALVVGFLVVLLRCIRRCSTVRATSGF